ncbi:MAG: hypothetical protein ACJ76I_04555 [Gaiellaceae bacterium]
MTNTLLTRIGGLCGAAYVLVAVVANDVVGSKSPDSTAGPHAIGTWWRSHPPTVGDWVGIGFELSALLLFPVFICSLAWVLGRAEGTRGTWLPSAVFGFGLLSAGIKLGSAAPMFALAWRARDMSDGLATALVDMNGAAFLLTWALDAIVLAAAGSLILTTRCLPRWLGWWAVATAPLLLVVLPLGNDAPPTFLFALIWFLATGITLARRPDRTVGFPAVVAPSI